MPLRAVFTALPIAVWLLLNRIPLPAVNSAPIAAEYSPWLASISVGTLGITPFISAFLLVELAAVIVPGWRSLRTSGWKGRRTLKRSALALTFIFAGVQAGMVAVNLEGLEFYGAPVVQNPGAAFRLLTMLTAITATFVLVAAADIATQNGIGNGFATLLAAAVFEDAYRTLSTYLHDVDLAGTGSQLDIFFGAILVVLLCGATWRMLSAPTNRGADIRVPASGLSPLYFAASLLMLPATLVPVVPDLQSASTALVPGSLAYTAAYLVSMIAGVTLFSWLYNQPRRVAGVTGDEASARRGLRRGMVRTTLGFGGLFLLAGFAADSGVLVYPVSVFALVAVAMDFRTELRARTAAVDLVPVRPLHRIYAVAAVLEALEQHSICAHPRNLTYRSLFPFSAPFVPVTIMVPERQVDQAEAVLAGLLDGDARPAVDATPLAEATPR